MTDALLSRRIRDHVEALIAGGAEGHRLPTMGELRRRFGGASNGAIQQALGPLKASGAIVTTRGPRGGHFIGPKAAAEPRSILLELRVQLDAAAAALRAAETLLGELENDRHAAGEPEQRRTVVRNRSAGLPVGLDDQDVAECVVGDAVRDASEDAAYALHPPVADHDEPFPGITPRIG